MGQEFVAPIFLLLAPALPGLFVTLFVSFGRSFVEVLLALVVAKVEMALGAGRLVGFVVFFGGCVGFSSLKISGGFVTLFLTEDWRDMVVSNHV